MKRASKPKPKMPKEYERLAKLVIAENKAYNAMRDARNEMRADNKKRVNIERKWHEAADLKRAELEKLSAQKKTSNSNVMVDFFRYQLGGGDA